MLSSAHTNCYLEEFGPKFRVVATFRFGHVLHAPVSHWQHLHPLQACRGMWGSVGASCTAGVSPYTRCGELGPGSRILEILSGHGLAGGRCTGARWALRRVRGGCVGTHLDHDHDTLSTGDARTHTHRLDQIRTTACRPIAKPAQTDHKCDRSRPEACHGQQ